MVFFHSVDIVLGRENVVRKAWQTRCYLPKTMFEDQRKKRRRQAQFKNYPYFKRMLAVKEVVYNRHREMLGLYERYCAEASVVPYWGDDDAASDDGDNDDNAVVAAADTNEADCDDGF